MGDGERNKVSVDTARVVVYFSLFVCARVWCVVCGVWPGLGARLLAVFKCKCGKASAREKERLKRRKLQQYTKSQKEGGLRLRLSVMPLVRKYVGAGSCKRTQFTRCCVGCDI